MNRVHLVLGLFIAAGSFAGGWVARDVWREQPPQETESDQPRSESSPRVAERARDLPRVASARDDCPRAEYEELLELNAQLLDEVGRCQVDQVAWPDGAVEQWGGEAFQDKAVRIITEAGHDGDIEFYCDEFPCIAKLSGDADMHQIKELAIQSFGQPDVAHVEVRVHGIVGEYGRHRLGFIAAGPVEYVDDFTIERLDKRLADLVQEQTSEMKRAFERSNQD